MFASWASRIPDVKHLLHLNNGQLGTVKASIAITIVSSISFFGFLIGPPVIGWLAEAFNLRVALSIASLLGLTIVILSRRVKNRQ